MNSTAKTISASEIARGELEDLPLEQFLTYRLLLLTNRLNRQAMEILDEACGLRLPEWRCLAFIGRAGRISLAAISETTTMDRALVSRSVQGLVEQGLAQTVRDLKDRRVVFADLTEAGRRMHRAVLPKMQARQARLLGALTDPERRQLYVIMDKLTDCLDHWNDIDADEAAR